MVCIGPVIWQGYRCNSGSKADVYIKGDISYDHYVSVGNPVRIIIEILSTASFTDNCADINIKDRYTDELIYQSSGITVSPGTIATHTVDLVMPDVSIWNLHITLKSEFLAIPLCQDFRDIAILKDDPTLPHYNICDSTNICRRIVGTGTNQCINVGGICESTGGCKTGEIDVMGLCVPKPVALLSVALIGLYIVSR